MTHIETQARPVPLQMHEIGGVVLAGGKSSRMGGGDKGMLRLGDRPMLAHVIAKMRPQVACLALNASGEASRFSEFGLPVISDRGPEKEGPLAGVLAGIDWARKQPGLRAIVTVSTDSPFIPADLVARLTASGAPLVCAVSHAHVHPTISLWPLSIASSIEQALAEGQREMMAFVVGAGARLADVRQKDQNVDPMFNVNTPEELDIARRFLQSSGA